MRAWRNTERGFEEVELPDPELGSEQVRVAVEGVVFGPSERASRGELVPGGAAVGRVEACGDAAQHLAGVRVLVGPAAPCGECDVCRSGAAAVCPQGDVIGRSVHGALATHVVAPARWVCPLADELAVPGPAAAIIARELALAFAMIARCGLGPGEPVVIAGDDVVSRFLFAVAVERGTTPIVLTDDDELAAVVARAGGRAVSAASATRESLRETAAELQLGERPWRIFAANAKACAHALQLAGPGTLMVIGGDEAATTSIELTRVAELGVMLLGVPRAHPDLLTEAAALVATNAVDLADYVEVRPIADGAYEPTGGRALVLTP